MANARKRFVLCIKNRGFEVSLEPRKLYEVLTDRDAARHQQLRVVDESGEGYLYPEDYFREINLPQSVRRAVLAAA
jgi:archaellum component FlaG (FlaF/FlaG flagellin family)